jgi:polyisoprenyl-phosphate glycosyltransferase
MQKPAIYKQGLPDGSEHKPWLSVVVPCYNEESVIEETHKRLTKACVDAVGVDYAIVYVNDGSQDRTWELLEHIAATDSRVIAVKLSRNFGHQIALTAGLSFATGERTLMIDADLQDPPELLAAMMAEMDKGADVIYGKRTERQGETAFKKVTASVFYRILSRLTDIDIPQDVGDFRLVSRRVLDALLSLPEQHRFVRGMVAWLGYNQVAFPYVRNERYAGETKYPVRKMLRLAADAMTGFSVRPLRLGTWLSVACFVLSLVLCGYALVSWMYLDVVKGWTSLVILGSLFAAANFLCLGIFGEYLGRMFQQSKQRPLYFVSEVAVSSVAAHKTGEIEHVGR